MFQTGPRPYVDQYMVQGLVHKESHSQRRRRRQKTMCFCSQWEGRHNIEVDPRRALDVMHYIEKLKVKLENSQKMAKIQEAESFEVRRPI